MKRPTELIENAKGFKSTDPIRVLAEYAVTLEGTQAEGNGVTDDAEVVQAMLNKSQPRKTVSDAVDYYNGIWPDDTLGVICFDDEYGWRCWNVKWVKFSKFYQVCTREEFEAEVERRKIREITDTDSLTHVAPNGEPCRVLYEDDRSQLIEYQDGTRACYFVKSHYATKRKPTISKAESDAVKAYHAWAKDRFVVDLDEYLEQFEVK